METFPLLLSKPWSISRLVQHNSGAFHEWCCVFVFRFRERPIVWLWHWQWGPLIHNMYKKYRKRAVAEVMSYLLLIARHYPVLWWLGKALTGSRVESSNQRMISFTTRIFDLCLRWQHLCRRRGRWTFRCHNVDRWPGSTSSSTGSIFVAWSKDLTFGTGIAYCFILVSGLRTNIGITKRPNPRPLAGFRSKITNLIVVDSWFTGQTIHHYLWEWENAVGLSSTNLMVQQVHGTWRLGNHESNCASANSQLGQGASTPNIFGASTSASTGSSLETMRHHLWHLACRARQHLWFRIHSCFNWR